MSSDADIVLLSLLAEQPRHGYDLDRVIEQRGYRQWTSLAFSSVYYLLKRLSERGRREPDEGSQGRRTVFRVTEALLAQRAEALLGRLDELRALRAQVDEEHALAIFDYEILRQEADLTWTRSLLKKVDSDED